LDASRFPEYSTCAPRRRSVGRRRPPAPAQAERAAPRRAAAWRPLRRRPSRVPTAVRARTDQRAPALAGRRHDRPDQDSHLPPADASCSHDIARRSARGPSHLQSGPPGRRPATPSSLRGAPQGRACSSASEAARLALSTRLHFSRCRVHARTSARRSATARLTPPTKPTQRVSSADRPSFSASARALRYGSGRPRRPGPGPWWSWPPEGVARRAGAHPAPG